MKLTNKYGLPQTLVNVLERPTYSKGKANLSVTQLLNSPKIVALTKKFDNELEQDVSEMIWPLLGSAMHNVLEHGKDDNHIVEQRIHTEHDGYHISGAIDLQEIEDGGIHLSDYKMTSAWTVMNTKPEWEQQLNVYAWLVEKEKKQPVLSLGILAFIRDWNRNDAKTKENYPPASAQGIPIKLWSYEEREKYVSDRISAHSACEFAMEIGGDLPDCTPEEMWEKPTKWAIKKIGGVRAKAVYDNEEEAQKDLEALGKDYMIEHRPGERTRCEKFCQVNTYCQQYRDYLNNKGN